MHDVIMDTIKFVILVGGAALWRHHDFTPITTVSNISLRKDNKYLSLSLIIGTPQLPKARSAKVNIKCLPLFFTVGAVGYNNKVK